MNVGCVWGGVECGVNSMWNKGVVWGMMCCVFGQSYAHPCPFTAPNNIYFVFLGENFIYI
jgi:hypothetical protein